MSAKTIIRHECDHCGRQFEETSDGWLPCGGSENWSAWRITPVTKKGTAPHFYAANCEKEFCSYDCAMEWMRDRKEGGE